ncbi:hypothetical protein [Vagococcus acidifermentans]|uniref:Uncharacterized protein n=1 Tax=Vagococcus acidifermentans TaxID=564710 RepID=A0A430AWU4_9ENTE|nr:hypothetical protein [Vagococcus acidifermentans]RSU12515.1 hypothetical protein CBF27_05950 [Vagococcus acidifermentans]
MSEKKDSKMILAKFGFLGLFLTKITAAKKKYTFFLLASLSFAVLFIGFDLFLDGLHGQKMIRYIIVLAFSIIYGACLSAAAKKLK